MTKAWSEEKRYVYQESNKRILEPTIVNNYFIPMFKHEHPDRVDSASNGKYYTSGLDQLIIFHDTRHTTHDTRHTTQKVTGFISYSLSMFFKMLIKYHNCNY
jgi:hypothetical protein